MGGPRNLSPDRLRAYRVPHLAAVFDPADGGHPAAPGSGSAYRFSPLGRTALVVERFGSAFRVL